MSLARVLEAAIAQGQSVVPRHLLPAGFTCYPVESREVRMGRVAAFAREEETLSLGALQDVKSFERRSPTGKEEVVRSFEREGHGWAHPEAVGGHKVLGVYTHPQASHAIYDLGHGLHAEGAPPAKPGGAFRPGAVMKSNTGLQREALAEKGWKSARPPKPSPAAKPRAGSKPSAGAGTARPGGVKTTVTTAKGGKGLPDQKFVHRAAPGGLLARKTGAAPKPGALAKVAKAGAKPGGFKAAKPKVAARIQRGLAEQQRDYLARQGYKVDPRDWKQDWVPLHEDRITPDLHPSGDIKDLGKSGRVGGEGTAADPIDVKGNIHDALRLLSQGKHVRLNRPAELTLLMQAVRQHAAETEAAGKNDKPDWDFGRLTVKGTNLFAGQNKGIRRIHMPQFSGLAQPGTHAAQVAGGAGKFADLTDEFEQHLKDQGIKVTRATMPASHLKATQSELVGAKVAGFAHAFLSGNPKAVKAMSEPIMVTKDGYVVDGHHRWGANMLVDAVDGKLGNDTPMNVRKVDMEIGAMIPHANSWAQQVGIASAAANAGDTGAALKK